MWRTIHLVALSLVFIIASGQISARASSPPFSYQTLDFPSAFGTELDGIDNGRIIGGWENDDSTLFRNGFIYDGSTFKPINFPGSVPYPFGTQPFGILGNTVVGDYYDQSEVQHGFIYDETTYHTFDHPDATQVRDPSYLNGGATGISGNKIVGWYKDATGSEHGYVYDGTTFTTLHDPLVDGNVANAIDGNNIVGTSSPINGAHEHGYLYNGHNYSIIADPLADDLGTVVTGISGNYIVGFFSDRFGTHGFLFDGTNYRTIDVPGSEWTTLRGIQGNVLVGNYGIGASDGYRVHGIIITIPEPATLWLLAAGGVIAFAAKRAKPPT